MPSETRVVIIAADPLARTALAALLRAQDSVQVAGQADDRDDLRQACAVYRPDVLLWDVGWDGAERLEVLSALAEEMPPILAIAADDSAATLWAAGVRGVVGRTVNAELLAAALAAVANGLGVFQPTQSTERAVPPSRAFAGNAPPELEALTPREMDVLVAMADGLSNKLIARALGISEHTVKYHVNSILGKLDAQSRTDAVVRATRAGILLL